MALTLGPVTIANPIWFWALTSLIPFILIYLIRPRPTRMNIPSLMFFITKKRRAKHTAFLRNILQDLLFLLQLLIILLLALQLVSPFTSYYHDVTAEHTAIVIDVSASSQVKENGKTRFDKAIAQAKKVLGSKNTIVLAKGTPLIGIQGVDGQQALDYLDALQPKATNSKIGEGILLAGEALGGGEGRVVVISDFINTGGTDPETAKNILASKEIVVDFINVATLEEKSNVGIVNMDVDEDETIVYIKNYNKQQETAEIKVGDLKKEITIAANSIEPFTFETPPGITKIELKFDDDFAVDNTAYLSAPEREKISIMLITNNESVFLKYALTSGGNVDLEVAEPPIVPKDQRDVYVIHNIDAGQMLPGTLEDIKEKVRSGSSLIIHAQSDMAKINYKNLLPVTVTGLGKGSFINVDQVNRFTKNIEFGEIKDYFVTTANPGTVTLVSAAQNSSIIAFNSIDRGKIIYYGILDQSSDFKFSPAYPIFWTSVLDFLTDQRNIKNLNLQSGESLVLDKPVKIKTPTRTVTQSVLVFELIGIYTIGNQDIAVNLLSEEESDITPKKLVGETDSKFILKPVKEKRDFNFEVPFIIAAMLLLLTELIVAKLKGDL